MKFQKIVANPPFSLDKWAEGFAGEVKNKELTVYFPEKLLECYSQEKRAAIIGVLKQDPRAAYNKKPDLMLQSK